MEPVPENTTVEEFTQLMAMQLGTLPKGEIRDALADQFVAFRAQIDFLETCFELNPNERLPKN